jgi:hypothetical protein
MNATAGHAEIAAPVSPYAAPNAMFAAIVAATPRPSMTLASGGAALPARASSSMTSDAATIRPSTESGSRRAAVPAWPCARPRS